MGRICSFNIWLCKCVCSVLLVEMMMQRVIVSKHQKTSMYLGQWNRNNVPVGNYFGLDCTIVIENLTMRIPLSRIKLLVISSVKRVERNWERSVDYWVMRKRHTISTWKRLWSRSDLTNRVPHALPGRDNTATDIHGMSGIPEIAVFGRIELIGWWIEYKVKKAKQLGLPIPTREAAVIRNPQQEFAAKLAEKRVHTQMADSIASMVCFVYVFEV